jgi:hypothetical protein
MIVRQSGTLAVIYPGISVHFEQPRMSAPPSSRFGLLKRVDDFR